MHPRRWGTEDAEIKCPCQSFPVSKPVIGWNIALHAVPAYRASTYLVYCLPSSVNFIYSQFLQSSTVESVLNSESEFSLVAGIHFVLP